MKDRYIKVAAATPRIRVGDCMGNANEMIRVAREANTKGAKLVVFPELCVTGYTCGDLFGSRVLTDGAMDALDLFLMNTSELDSVFVIGLPILQGDKLYNCAAVCSRGSLLGLVPKSHIPNYSEHYEYRYFTPAGKENSVFNYKGEYITFGTGMIFTCEELPEFRIGVEICEDLWVASPASNFLTNHGATVIANCSASSASVTKDNVRRSLVTGQSSKGVCGYVYANPYMGESTTDLVFSGHDIIAECGDIIAERKPFGDPAEDLVFSEIDLDRIISERRRKNTVYPADDRPCAEIPFCVEIGETELTRHIPENPFIPDNKEEVAGRCEQVLSIQTVGLATRIEAAHSDKLIVGVSGGLDSTLALLASVRTVDFLKRDRRSVIAVTMPCFGTTATTKGSAEELCKCLGVELRCIDIKNAVNAHFADIGHDPKVLNAVYENAQARERTQVLMDIANAENGLVIGTGDLSELALGFATYNGDQMSMYSLNASVPKTLVKEIVHYSARVAKENGDDALFSVLEKICATPISPELLPADEKGNIAQVTEDLVGPYELHDFFIFYTVRYGYPPEKILRMAEYAFKGRFSSETIKKWLGVFVKRFFTQQFKRSCMPDGPKTGSVGLSPRGDFRMPSDASNELWKTRI